MANTARLPIIIHTRLLYRTIGHLQVAAVDKNLKTVNVNNFESSSFEQRSNNVLRYFCCRLFYLVVCIRSTTVTRLNITRFQPIVGLRLTKKNVHIECFVLRFEGKNLILGILKGYALIFAGLRILFANLRYNSC